MKINFATISVAPVEELTRRRKWAGKQNYRPVSHGSGPIAIVGNGPSVVRHLGEIASFPTVWAINSAVRVLRSHLIQSTLFTIDPMPGIAEFAEMVDKVIVTDYAHPDVLKVAKNIEMFPAEGMIHGSTTATAAPHIALSAGYEHLHFFGCEGSFEETTHADGNIEGDRLDVVCNGDIYETNPQMFIQCQALSPLFRDAPEYFSESSGGLLRAMVRDADYDIVRANKEFADSLNIGAENGVHQQIGP